MPAQLDFWFDFASTYSYLSATRVEGLAAERGVAVTWRPFLLGPIFKAQGWSTSPFELYPAKGRYMVRDIGRIAASRGVAFVMPQPFPQNGLHAARVALAIGHTAARATFARHVFEAEFADGADISSPDVIARCLALAAVPVEETIDKAASAANKDTLRAETNRAVAAGIFGAPTFVAADGELFWGDDRLEMAIEHAVRVDRPVV